MDIRRLTNKDNILLLCEMHKAISKNNNLKDILIYYDKIFFDYLLKIINDTDQYFYGVFVKNKLVGFIHFKIYNNTLFLNNIFLNEKFRGGGRGSLFLKTVIENFKESFDKFSLDVVISNDVIYNWYLRLGLKPVTKSKWVKILKTERIITNDICLIFKKDVNQFNSVFFKDLKIATVVSKNKLIIHHIEFLDELFKLDYELYTHLSAEEILLLDSVLLEETVRMEGDFKEFLKKLNNNA